MHFTRSKSRYFASYYRPPNNHLQSLEALHESLTNLYRSQKLPNVIIAGHFNLPDINWSNQQTTNNRTANKHNKLLEIINGFELQNMVNDPTRVDSGNILDLIKPINNYEYTYHSPGMSDHEAVNFNVNLKQVRNTNHHTKYFSTNLLTWIALEMR